MGFEILNKQKEHPFRFEHIKFIFWLIFGRLMGGTQVLQSRADDEKVPLIDKE